MAVLMASSSGEDGVASDLPQHRALLAEVQPVIEKARVLIRRLRDSLASDDDGLSFLTLKNLLMTQYLANLTEVMRFKSRGQAIEGHAAVERLVTLRTVLEKMRPIERKLKYQIDKALKVAESGRIKADDPLHFKPDPRALMSKMGGTSVDEGQSSGDEEDDEETPLKKADKYVVPKHVPAFFEGGRSQEEAERDQAKKARKSVLSRGLIEDLKRQHLDTPEEIHEREDVMRQRHIHAMKERVRYEEDNFMRLPVPKRLKHARGQMNTIGNIGDEVTGMANGDGPNNSGGRKRKSGGKSFKKGAAKKKFRR